MSERGLRAQAGVEEHARITLRPIANPLPLGFAGLAVATFLLAGLQLDWLSPAESRHVALALVAFVFPVQLLASIFGYLARDVAAGTGMGILAGTWLTVGLVLLTSPPGATSDALGLLLLIAAVAMLVPAGAAAAGKLVPTTVLLATALRFGATGVYELSASHTWEVLSGLIGLALAALALYTAFAMAFDDARSSLALPLGRRGTGRSAIEGDLAAQIGSVENEVGVREEI